MCPSGKNVDYRHHGVHHEMIIVSMPLSVVATVSDLSVVDHALTNPFPCGRPPGLACRTPGVGPRVECLWFEDTFPPPNGVPSLQSLKTMSSPALSLLAHRRPMGRPFSVAGHLQHTSIIVLIHVLWAAHLACTGLLRASNHLTSFVTKRPASQPQPIYSQASRLHPQN